MIKLFEDRKECTGCGACRFVCPKDAVRMEADEEGFAVPVVDGDKCIDCGACLRICPVRNAEAVREKEEPRFFVAKPYTWGLLALSVALLVRWEVTFYRHPERFSDATNDYLRCANCTEKLCSHKKQLKRLWKQVAAYTAERRWRLQK